VPQDYNTSSAVPCLFILISCYSLSLYPFTERYAQPYFFSCLIRQIRAEIREEFRTGSGPSGSGGNPPPVTIHTWLERFNKQKPRSFEKATAPVDAKNWISHMEMIFDVMGYEDAFKTRLAVYKFEGDSLAWWKAYKKAKGGDVWLITTSTEFMQCFLRLAGFLGAAAGTAEEQAKNFQWGLCKSTLNHLMCIRLWMWLSSYFMHVDLIRGVDVYSDFLMVNTRTDAELATAVQNALQTLLPQIRAEIREEFCTGSGPSSSGEYHPPITIHTWLERFNKQKPRSFKKATALVDAENWISHMEKIFDIMGCEDAFMTRLAVYKFEGDALAWWKAYKQAKGGDVWLITVTWAEFKDLGCHNKQPISSGQVANVARNYEILHERDDAGAELPDKRQKSGDWHQPTTQQSSHRKHGFQQSRGPSEGYS
nr:hypothetical protein [Tanacetum cinerariifolium]